MLNSLNISSVLTNDQKITILENYLTDYPLCEIQDIYKWMYYGEFGQVDNAHFSANTEFHILIKELKETTPDKLLDPLSERIWDPAGFSMRFVTVYISTYSRMEYPLLRLVNLMDRSAAFQGSRMQFKLDWSFFKEYMISINKYSRQEFYSFEDRIGFYQIPEIQYSEKFLINYYAPFRIVPRKLFFDFFPEFNDHHDIDFEMNKFYFME